MFVLEGIWSCHKNALRCEALRLEPQVRAEKTISYKSNGGAGDTKELLKQEGNESHRRAGCDSSISQKGSPFRLRTRRGSLGRGGSGRGPSGFGGLDS